MTQDGIWLTDSLCYLQEANAILSMDSLTSMFDEKNLSPFSVDKYSVVPWGAENLLPQRVMNAMERAEIVSTNADFNWKACYGNGPRLVRLIRDTETNKVKDFYELSEGPEYEFFVKNNVIMYLQETLTDLSYFHNAFPVLVASKDWKSISCIRHREAVFSRWGVDKKGNITTHLYSSKWDTVPGKGDVEESYVLDEYNAYDDCKKELARRKYSRMCYPLYMPSPGRTYYSYPGWYSIFRSGWFDNITSIPALKKAILKHNLGVRYIIYISPAYFDKKEREAGINKTDIEACKELRKQLVDDISNVITGAENAGKVIAAIREFIPTGSSAIEDKYISVETIKNNIVDGEYLTDYETGANVISYAMEVHPSLIGAVPGKNSNSLSGSNQRELFMMKQALSRPMIDVALSPFNVIKRINGWDKDVVVAVPEYIFTTLDHNKSGKLESTNVTTK